MLVHDTGGGVVAALNVAAVLAGERVMALLVEHELAAAVERVVHALGAEEQPQPELDGGSEVAWLPPCTARARRTA